MPHKLYHCKVENVIEESDMVRRFIVKFPDEISFRFIPGQFVIFDLPIGSKDTLRSYSIASPPVNDNTIELLIVLNPKGLGTPYLFNNIHAGSSLEISDAMGKFRLPEVIESDLCFICTGTGIAPFRSMLLDILNKDISHKDIFLIFGNRYEKDILYRKEMEELQTKINGFKFIPVLSRNNPEWQGRKGYVHQLYEELFADKRPAQFYICGWKDMLHEARKRIEAMGYDKKSIKFEIFD
jgi:CDP-4-dehydro-6-deoxyglucose reductase